MARAVTMEEAVALWPEKRLWLNAEAIEAFDTQ